MGLPGLTRAVADRRYPRVDRLRRRHLPGLAALPTVLASPPATTLSAANAASGIASVKTVAWDEPGAFTYLGGKPATTSATEGYCGMFGVYSYHDQPWWAVECEVDLASTTFEVRLKGNASKARLWLDGQLVSAGPTVTTASGNAGYLLSVVTTAGTHRVRIGLDGPQRFGGLNVGPTDAVRATPTPAPRLVVAGDSYTLPTISDSGSFCYDQGFTPLLGLMLGVDVWAMGRGGTGYVNPGAYVTMADTNRVAEIIAQAPDIILWFGSINDQTYGATAAQVGAASLAAFQQVAAALPNCLQIVSGPTWRQGYTWFPSGLLAKRDALKASALAVGGLFLDILSFPLPAVTATPFTTTLAGSSAAGASLSMTAAPAVGMFLQIGSGDTQEIRKVFSVTGTGPYTVAPAEHSLSQAHTAGEAVVQVGPSLMTGTGKQGATTGDGNADRYLGSDNTHPTIAGHLAYAKALLWLYQNALTY